MPYSQIKELSQGLSWRDCDTVIRAEPMRVKDSESDDVQWGVMAWRGIYLQGWSLGAGCGDHTAARLAPFMPTRWQGDELRNSTLYKIQQLTTSSRQTFFRGRQLAGIRV